MEECKHHLQALISHSSLGTPDAIDAVAAQHSDWIPASRSSCCKAKLASIPLRAAIGEYVSVTGFHFTSILQDQSICAMFVERSTPLHGLESDDTRMMCEKGVDPPTVKSAVHTSDRCSNLLSGSKAKVAYPMRYFRVQLVRTVFRPAFEKCLETTSVKGANMKVTTANLSSILGRTRNTL